VVAELPDENVASCSSPVCAPGAWGQGTVVDHVRLFRNLRAAGASHPWRSCAREAPRCDTTLATWWCSIRLPESEVTAPSWRATAPLALEYQEQPTIRTRCSTWACLPRPGKAAEALDYFRRTCARARGRFDRGKLSRVSPSVSANWAVRPTRSRHVVRVGGTIRGRGSCCKRRARRWTRSATSRAGRRAWSGCSRGRTATLRKRGHRHPRYLTRHPAGRRYVKGGPAGGAEAQWGCAGEQPRDMPAFHWLGDLFMAQSSWPMPRPAAGGVGGAVARQPAGRGAARRKHLASRNIRGARLLERAIAQHPRKSGHASSTARAVRRAATR